YLASNDQYNVEVWMLSSQELMVTMTDNCATAYQAVRLNMKYVTRACARELVPTSNNAGDSLGRMLVSIVADLQQAFGSVLVPDVLQRWVGTDRLTPGKLAALTK